MLTYRLFGCFSKQFMDSSQQRMLIYRLCRLFLTSENSLRVLQVTDVNLSLVQFLLQISENSLRIPPNNGCQSIACSDPQFRDGPKLGHLPDIPFQMASLSPSPTRFLSLSQMASLSPSPNGISKPIPASIALTSANFRAL